jgi:hypothetical protein
VKRIARVTQSSWLPAGERHLDQVMVAKLGSAHDRLLAKVATKAQAKPGEDSWKLPVVPRARIRIGTFNFGKFNFSGVRRGYGGIE